MAEVIVGPSTTVDGIAASDGRSESDVRLGYSGAAPHRPYPPMRHLAEAGEVTAAVRPSTTVPDIRFDHGGTVDYLATGALTGGEFGLYRWGFSGPVSGPDPHFHRTMSESFFVLDGVVDIYDGRRWVPCTSGDYVYVPAGGLHGFKNRSGNPASMLLLFSPGAHREPYFETLDALGRGLLMTDAEREVFYAVHDNVWVDEL